MIEELRHLAGASRALAAAVPPPLVEALAAAVLRHGGGEWPAVRSAIVAELPAPEFRRAALGFLDCWRAAAARVPPGAAAAALIAAAEVASAERQDETVAGVWTGPDAPGCRFRRTEQAVLEVLDGARARLTVVSFAVYRIPRVREALVAAARRGVHIRVVIENADPDQGRGEYDCLAALGAEVAAVATVYYWPRERRGHDPATGRGGSLHVKCAVADGSRLFLSSANLTEYAFTVNMELGLLVTGGRLPGEVERHFDMLIDGGCLARV